MSRADSADADRDMLDAIQADSEKDAEPTGSMDRLMALADEMENLKAVIEEQDREVKEMRKRYDELRRELLPEEMKRVGLVNEQGKGNFTLKTGGKIHLRGDLFASIKKADQDAAFEWLRANGHGDLIKETVHPGTLKSFCKEQLEHGANLPALLNAQPFTVATLTRRKS